MQINTIFQLRERKFKLNLMKNGCEHNKTKRILNQITKFITLSKSNLVYIKNNPLI